MPEMPRYVYAILIAGWIAWCAPFFLIRNRGGKAATIDRRARWGIVLEGIGFAIVWQVMLWTRTPAVWRVFAGTPFLALAALLSWTSARTLGRQWRFDAGLNADHRLVKEGAYRYIRHPIYASMLCLLMGVGLLVTRIVLIPPALVFFIAGTEIRVRIEDRLLASRFGAEFEAYRREVPAYIPFVR